MNKKLLLTILTILSILFYSVVCFATNENTNLGNELQDSANKSENTIQNAGEGIKNMASDIGNGVQNVTSDIGRGIQNVFTTDNNTDTDMADMGATNTDGYTATRTTTDGANTGIAGINQTTWIWLIMGIVAIAIIALTWYYVTQNNDTRR